MPHRQVSKTHSTRTFTVSRERQKPASSMTKPTCMANTRKAAISVQTVLRGLTMSLAATTGGAGAGAAGAGAAAATGAVVPTTAGGFEAGGTSARAELPLSSSGMRIIMPTTAI